VRVLRHIFRLTLTYFNYEISDEIRLYASISSIAAPAFPHCNFPARVFYRAVESVQFWAEFANINPVFRDGGPNAIDEIVKPLR
jgi:hypothetical protein